MQGYAGLYRPCTMHRALEALHYTHGCTGPAPLAGMYRPCTIRMAVRAFTIHRAVQPNTVHAGLYRPLFAELYRPRAIARPRAVLTLHYTQGCIGTALYGGMCRPSTMCWTLEVLHHLQDFAIHALYAGICRPCIKCERSH